MNCRAALLTVRTGFLLAQLGGCFDAGPPLEPVGVPPAEPPVERPLTPPGELPGWLRFLDYDRAGEHRVPAGARSRYLLFEDSTFRLYYQAPPRGFIQYGGSYSRADSLITFRFEATSGLWQAAGTVREGSLIIKYDDAMAQADFEDGVYVLTRDYLASAGDLHLALADGSGITRLTRGSWPTWSPDGRRIAFHRDAHLYVIDADGSSEIQLAAGGLPAWSPDGTRIVFANAEGISVINADGSGRTTLLRHDFLYTAIGGSANPEDMGIGKPVWSPDGRHIAFEHLGADLRPAQIYVMNANGSGVRSLTGSRCAESDPTWLPGGSRIAFWSFCWGITTADTDGGAPATIYHDFPAVAYGAKPTWSPDGRTLAFNAWFPPPMSGGIWIVAFNSGDVRELIPGGWDAAWSPDGAHIAFVRPRSR